LASSISSSKLTQFALEIFLKIDYPKGTSNALNNLANIEVQNGNFGGAINLHQEALIIREKMNNTFLIAESHKNLAQTFIRLNDGEKAQFHLEEGIRNASEIGSKKALKNLFFLQYELFSDLKKYEDALNSYIQYSELSTSLISEEGQKRMAELEAEFEFTEKERQIEILDQNNLLQSQRLQSRTIFLLLALTLLILSLSLFFLILRQQKLKANLMIELNRQKLLRSQMNPHFIYNALSAIQNFVLQHDSIDSVSYISDFARLMRLVLEGSRANWVSLDDDIELANSYLKLQQLRFDNSFSFDIQIDESLNTEWVKVPPMLSQPFIENAVEHGMRPLESKEGKINVSYKMNNQDLIIRIEDNGKGFTEAKTDANSKHRPMARQITDERISVLKKTRKLDISLQITSRKNPNNTIVSITIPQKHQND